MRSYSDFSNLGSISTVVLGIGEEDGGSAHMVKTGVYYCLDVSSTAAQLVALASRHPMFDARCLLMLVIVDRGTWAQAGFNGGVLC
jgi:hypothetical protein